MTITILVIAVMMILFSLIVKTSNVKSTLFFKAMPMLSALYLMFYAFVQFGWINIGG